MTREAAGASMCRIDRSPTEHETMMPRNDSPRSKPTIAATAMVSAPFALAVTGCNLKDRQTGPRTDTGTVDMAVPDEGTPDAMSEPPKHRC